MNYRARNFSGAIIEGTLEAESEQDLRLSLSKKGLQTIEVNATDTVRRESLATVSVSSLIFGRVRGSELRWITGQLALMLETGTTVSESLDALIETTEGRRVGEILSTIAASVRGGSTFSDSLAEHPTVFSNFYVSAVRAGESSGTMPEVFERIELHMKKRQELLNIVATALIYPTILMLLGAVAVIVMLTFVIPKFLTVFANFNAELPLSTQILMGMAAFLQTYWFVVPVIIIVPPIFFYWYATSNIGKPVIDRVVLSIPIIGPLTRSIQSSLLMRTLSMLLNAGVPITESIDVAEGSCSNVVFKRVIRNIGDGVIRGEGFAANFAKVPYFDPSTKQMIITGERTGSMAKVMGILADHLDEAIDKQFKRLSALAEPLIIVIMGIVIGFMAVSLLAPLFSLTTAVRGG